MDNLQLTVLALFYLLATGGYVWATAGRLWRGKSVAPSVQPAAAIRFSPASSKEEVTIQPQLQPPPSAGKAEDKSAVLAGSLRTPQTSRSRPGRLRRLFGSKGPRPPIGDVKPSAPRRGFSLRRRKEATSGAGPAGEVQLQQEGMKLQAQQAVQVGVPRGEEKESPAVQQAQVQGEDRVLIDSYAVMEPFVRIGISLEPDGSEKYVVFEPRLTKAEAKQHGELREALRHGLEIDVSKFDSGQAVAYLSSKTEDIMKKFGIRIPKISYEKIFYFIERDFLHYGKLDPVMRDPNIEDISCNGPALPVYVFHRTYESIPTNVTFKNQEELEKFVLRLSYLSGRNLSVSDPVVDASLPDGSRIQMTFGSEITKKGSTFTIRKFKEDPYSVIDLIRFKTITSEIAALLWFALENKSSVLMAGGTASGKTTTINCLALFIKPDMKIVTIEDTPEINLAHKNWIQSVSRQGFAGMGEVTLYDLLRAALRQRPDFIIPGEVRGEEAQTMFQAISTGHAGMSSIHADSITAVFHRLTNPPMNIPRTLIPALNFVLLQARVTVGGKTGRRILSVTEVVGLDTRTSELITNEIYRFNQDTDTYTYSGRSYMLEKLAKLKGMTNDEVRQELAARSHILQWMADKGMRKYREVASVIQRYYTDKPSLLAEMGGVGA